MYVCISSKEGWCAMCGLSTDGHFADCGGTASIQIIESATSDHCYEEYCTKTALTY